MKRESFKLKKVKVDKNLVTIDYSIDGSDKEYTEKCKTTPHPDLRNALDAFKPLIAEVFDMTEENEEHFTINGIIVSEKKDTEMVMILGSYETASGAKSAINSPLISMDDDCWENQKTLGEKTDSVVDECFEYLFNNKSAQLSLSLEEEDTNKNEESVDAF